MAGENSYKGAIDDAVREIDKIDTKLVALASSIEVLGNKAKESLGFLTPKTPSKLDEQLNLVKKALDGIANADDKVGDAMSQRMDKMRRLADAQSKFSKQHIQDQQRMMRETQKAAKIEERSTNEQIRNAKKVAASDAKAVVNKQELRRAADLEAKAISKLAGAYKNLVSKQKQAEKNLKDLVASQKASTEQIEKAQKEYNQYTARVKKADAATRSFTENNKKGIRGLTTVVGNLMDAFGLVGGIYLFAEMAKRSFRLAKQLDSLNFAMETTFKNEKEIARARAFLADTSEKYGAGIVSLTERYIKFTAAAKNSGLATEKIESIFNSFAKISGALGYDQQGLDSIFLALEQMISKGTVSAEELRQQLGEKLPGAFGIMVRAVQVALPHLNATDKNLISLMRKGEILAEDVLPEFARQSEIAFGVQNLERVENLNAATVRFSNAFTKMIQGFTEDTTTVSKIISFFAENLAALIEIIAYGATTWGAYTAAVGLASVGTSLMNKRLVIMRARSIAAAKGVTGLSFAWKRFSSFVKANAIGLAITAIAALVYGISKWHKSIEELHEINQKQYEDIKKNTEAQKEEIVTIGKLASRYDELTAKAELNKEEHKELNDIILQLKDNVPDTAKEFDEYGKVIGINTKRLREYNNERKQNLEIITKDAIKSNNDEIENTKERIDLIKGFIEYEKKNRSDSVFSFVREDAAESIANYSREIEKMYENLETARKRADGLEDTIISLNKAMFEARGGFSEKGTTGTPKPQAEQDPFSLVRGNGGEVEKQLTERNKLIAERSKLITELQSTKEKEGAATRENLRQEIKLLDIRIKAWDITIDKVKEAGEAFEEVKSVSAFGDIKTGPESGSIQQIEDFISKLKDARSSLNLTEEEYETFTRQIEKMTVAIQILKGEFDSSSLFEVPEDDDILEGLKTKLKEDIPNAMKRLADSLGADYHDLMEEFKSAYEYDYENFVYFGELKAKQQEKWEEKKKEILANFKEAAIGAATAIMEARAEKVQKEIDANREKYAVILSNEKLTEEQRSAIEAERDKKEILLEKKKRKRENETFLMKQGIALAEVIFNTAKGISEAVSMAPGTFGGSLLWIALLAATGAAQTAAILASSIPKFEVGTDNAPEGVALVDEKRPEVHTDKSGNVKSFGMSGANLRYLEKGDKIYKSHDDFFSQYNRDDVNRSVWDMNMRSNGRELSKTQVDTSLLREISGLKSSNEKVWKEVKKLASRPINVKNEVTIKDTLPY